MTTPLKAIRAKCLDCMCDQPSEVRICPSEACPLWPYRMGHNPARKGLGGNFVRSCTNDAIDGENDAIDGEAVAEEICEKFF